MKKNIERSIIGLLLFVFVLMGLIFLFPQVLYGTASGQKILLKIEGEQVAVFYFKKDQPAKDTLYMEGVIYHNTLIDIKNVLDKNPAVTTIAMVNVPGSIDDEINLVASREIRKRSIKHIIN